MANTTETTASAVTMTLNDGLAHIEQGTPLTRLHFFDGKFLSADALTLEQDYHRNLVRMSNLAGGWGVVHGLGIELAGDQLTVSPGLAITPAGSTVLAGQAFTTPVSGLLKVVAPAPARGNSAFGDCTGEAKTVGAESIGTGLYEITVGPVEGLCGNEAVYGKLCEDACVTDSQRPYWREGLVLRLRPITLKLPDSSVVALTNVHQRNRVASAYFASEPWLASPLLSANGLAGHVWCNPAQLYGRDEVPIGLLVREGASTRLIDAWSARRERMDTQARGYWQGRMAMRPWNVFLAQILQFQCQLSGTFDGTGSTIQVADDCGQLRQLLDKTRKELESLQRKYGESTHKILKRLGDKTPTKIEVQRMADEAKASRAELFALSEGLAQADLGKGALPANRMLLNAGFVELPPAGYLPVIPGKQSLEEQLSRMFGEGVHLHYHAVRHDEISHLVEEAQHMERISLTRGLDDPKLLEEVEIFVPDGKVVDTQAQAPGIWWQVDAQIEAFIAFILAVKGLDANQNAFLKAAIAKNQITQSSLAGLAHTKSREDGSYGFAAVLALDALGAMGKDMSNAVRASIYLSGDTVADPFSLPIGGDTKITAEVRLTSSIGGKNNGGFIAGDGRLTVLSQGSSDGLVERRVQLDMITLTLSMSNSAPRQINVPGAMRFTIQRKGNAASGIFAIDDENKNANSSPAYFEWDSSPRRAIMYTLEAIVQQAIRWTTEEIGSRAGTETPAAVEVSPGSAQPAATASETSSAPATSTHHQLMLLNALPGMPAITNTAGAAAFNAIIALADATDDPGFLARARRRLFPTLDVPPSQEVRAVLDWVMFRRSRSHLCAPPCSKDVTPTIESFQIWHLKLDDAGQLQSLTDALDKGDADSLAQFKFERVCILRYRDESDYSEESADRVRAMWQFANPGKQVVLGRVWEGTPATGQGWQNHFRLRNMLEQIAQLTTPPPQRGGNALAVTPPPPPPLYDGALDGGFLVVTQMPAARTHRVILYSVNVPPGLFIFDEPNKFQENPDRQWELLQEHIPMAVKRGTAIDLTLPIDANNQLSPASLNELKDGDKKMRGLAECQYRLVGLRVDAAQAKNATSLEAFHAAVMSNLISWGKQDHRPELENSSDVAAVKVGTNDLGGGTQVSSVVYYLWHKC